MVDAGLGHVLILRRRARTDRRPIADVGVVWSQQNHDYFGRDQARDKTLAPYRGVVKALDRFGITYMPLHADDIETAGKRFGVLILPNFGTLSDAQLAHVRSFVDGGGSVIATSESTLFDADGEARSDFALADLFGVHRRSGSHGALDGISGNLETHARHTYLRLAPELRGGVYGP